MNRQGRNVVLESKYGSPKIVNDGVTVAKEVELEDPVENIGAKLVRQVSMNLIALYVLHWRGTPTLPMMSTKLFWPLWPPSVLPTSAVASSNSSMCGSRDSSIDPFAAHAAVASSHLTWQLLTSLAPVVDRTHTRMRSCVQAQLLSCAL